MTVCYAVHPAVYLLYGMKIISTVQAIDKLNVLHVAESCGLFQAEGLGELGVMIDAFLSGE
jgi:hypothetical protein